MERKILKVYKPGAIVEGIYQSCGDKFGFLITDEFHEDVYISKSDRLNALNGDTIEVKIIFSYYGRHRNEGAVKRIIARANDTFTGTFKKTRFGGEVEPLDAKIPIIIDVLDGDTKNAQTGQRVTVKIDRWPGRRSNAQGVITEILGYEGDAGVDIDTIIAEHRLPHIFGNKVLEEANSLSEKIIPERNIEDYRNLQLITIDGADSKDLDDAVHCEKTENGNFILGVHIADVSRYVKKAGELDKEAYKRGTSVYLSDRVIPMLPFKLSNDLCSLNANKDRYAVSCIMEVTREGKIKTKKITPSIIRVSRRCTYPEINQIFEENIISEELKPFVPMLSDFRECTEILRKERIQRGALEFDFPEYKVILDKEGKPLRIEKRIRGISERMIEDAMIAANETVARFLKKTGNTSVYRIHEIPDNDKIKNLRKLMEVCAIPIKIPEKVQPEDLQKLLRYVKDKDIEYAIQAMTLRSLQQARYSTENEGHFGIASTCYTHFTSPIRRYPDLMVHRLIKDALTKQKSKSEREKETEFLVKAVEHCSETEQNATQTERDVTDLKITEYMTAFVGEPFDAQITGVTSFGIFVGLENGAEGLVHVNDMEDDEYVYMEDTMLLKGKYSGKTYHLGMPLKVTLVKADTEKKELDFIIGELKSPLDMFNEQNTKTNTKKKKKKVKNKRK